jgi:hypothetical protein
LPPLQRIGKPLVSLSLPDAKPPMTLEHGALALFQDQMNKRTGISAAVLALALFCSCASKKVQIVSLESDRVQRTDSLLNYSDSILDISFYFYSRSGNTAVIVWNKSGRPLFLDLKNSFLAVNGQTHQFWQDVSQFNGELVFMQYKSIFLQTNNPVNATIVRPERFSMIPPRAAQVIKPDAIVREKPYKVIYGAPKVDTVYTNWRSRPRRTFVSTVNFSRDRTPTRVRLFLALGRSENTNGQIYQDFEFWVSGIMEMDARQAVGTVYPEEFLTGAFTFGDRAPERADKHPYKKAWRFYLAD